MIQLKLYLCFEGSFSLPWFKTSVGSSLSTLDGARLATHKESLRLHNNRLNEPFVCAGIDPLLAEFGIRHRLESCVSD